MLILWNPKFQTPFGLRKSTCFFPWNFFLCKKIVDFLVGFISCHVEFPIFGAKKLKEKKCTRTAFGKKTLTIEPAVPPKSPKPPRCVPNIVLNGFNRAYSGRRHGAFKNGKPTRCGSGRIFWVILEVGFFKWECCASGKILYHGYYVRLLYMLFFFDVVVLYVVSYHRFQIT